MFYLFSNARFFRLCAFKKVQKPSSIDAKETEIWFFNDDWFNGLIYNHFLR
jgi:hypothetical protein